MKYLQLHLILYKKQSTILLICISKDVSTFTLLSEERQYNGNCIFIFVSPATNIAECKTNGCQSGSDRVIYLYKARFSRG